MKTGVLICCFIAALITGTAVQAHSKIVVTEPLSDLQVTDRADFMKQQLVATGKIDDSWYEAKASSVKRKIQDRLTFWVVTYNSEKADQGRLDIVLDALGNLVTASPRGLSE